jgi:hypothetical protein
VLFVAPAAKFRVATPRGRGPEALEGLRGFCFCHIAVGTGRTIQEADGVGFQFDDELLDGMVDGILAVADFDLTIIFVGGQFALNEDKRAFDQTADHLVVVRSKANDVMLLRFLLPLVVLVLPRFLGRHAELNDGRPVWELFAGGIFA